MWKEQASSEPPSQELPPQRPREAHEGRAAARGGGQGGTLQGHTGTGGVVKDRSPGLSRGLDMGTRDRKERKVTRCRRREWVWPGWGGSRRCGAAVALGGHLS